MGKEKFIYDEQYRQYKIDYMELLKHFKEIPTEEQLEKLRQQYLDRRSEK
jgi:hypothetical protein